MTYQQIESLIEGLSVKPTLPNLRRIIKHFSQFTDLEENLPPENLMVFSIFKLPQIWTTLLKLEQGEALFEEPSLGTSLYLKTYLNSLTKLLKQTSEEEVQHVILQGMTKAAPLTLCYRKIYREWTKEAMDIWASGSLGLKVRAFGLLTELLKLFEEEDKTWVLRRSYLKYMENCKQVSWRNFEAINLMINCFCEWSRLCPEVAYFVSFGHLRLILIQIDKVMKESKRKRKELIKKLYSFQILNCLKLLSSLITRVDHPSLSPLIYPLVQTLEVYSKLDLSTTFMPLRLHVLSFLQEISQRTGIFIPFLIELSTRELGCKEFLKFKPKSTQKNQSDLALIYQISPATHKTTEFWSDVFTEITKKIIFTASLFTRFISAAEIYGQIIKILTRESKIVKFAGYKIQIKSLIRILKADIATLTQDRYDKQKLPSQYPLIDSTDLELETIKQYQKNKKEDLILLKQKLAAEVEGAVPDAEGGEDRKEGRHMEEEEGEEEEDLSGASSYNPSEREESEDEQKMEEVSYEGDPENVDDLLKEWSEHEWSSQGELE